MRIYQTRTIPLRTSDPATLEAQLRLQFAQVIVYPGKQTMPKAELKASLRGIQILICQLTDRIDAEVLEAADSLQCVITYSAGTDHLDLPLLKARGIRVVHTPDVLTHATADLTWALILASARRLKPAQLFVEDRKFIGVDPSLFLGLELNGAMLGIIGMGRIGLAVAQRALGFGMRVLHTTSSKKDISLPGRTAELAEILEHSDVVTLHCPLTDKTRHLIGRRELSRMKPNGILINTSRGPVIDESALSAHLRTNPAFFAGLDVYENEPQIADGLLELPNAICLPHIGSATEGARLAMAQICLEEAVRFARGERLRYEYKT